LDPKVFFVSGKITVSLLAPPQYEKATHENASTSGDYASLAKEVSLQTNTEGNWTVVEVPALNPWGTLVVKEGRELQQ
jgi:hypothetical protein